MKEKIIAFLKSHGLISIRGLESESKVPGDTIQKAMQGKQGIPQKHIEKIREVISNYGFKNE